MPIKGVVCGKLEPGHSDGRRILTPIFNGDFTARQAKLAEINGGATVGGHYHDYEEMFYIIKGEIFFDLKDTRTGEKAGYRLEQDFMLRIPPLVAHKAEAKVFTIMVGFTEAPYVSAEENDHKYEV